MNCIFRSKSWLWFCELCEGCRCGKGDKYAECFKNAAKDNQGTNKEAVILGCRPKLLNLFGLNGRQHFF